MHKIRVMSYNIHSSYFRGSRRNLAALATVIRSEAPDLVVAQEAPRRFRWRSRSVGLARDWGMIFAGGGLWGLGNSVFSTLRVRVHETWNVRFPLTPGRHMRGAVFVRCSVGRTPFVVVGTHLSLDATERAAQAQLLKARLAQAEEPVIVCGDLNEDSGGSGWRTLVDGLLDAADVHGMAGTHTFSSTKPTRRIDGVFADPRCEVLGYRVLDTPQSRIASDHFPIVADVALPA